MRNRRIYVGGGQYAPSLDEEDQWESFVDSETDRLMSLTTQELEDDYDRTEPFSEREATEQAEESAYAKFGFSREHFYA